jgi:hypothetical protein
MAIIKANHQLFEIFGLLPKSLIQTGLISAKTSEPNISSLGPFKQMPLKKAIAKKLWDF